MSAFYVLLGSGAVLAYMLLGYGVAVLVAFLKKAPAQGQQDTPLMQTWAYLYFWPLIFVALAWAGVKGLYALVDRSVQNVADRRFRPRPPRSKPRRWF